MGKRIKYSAPKFYEGIAGRLNITGFQLYILKGKEKANAEGKIRALPHKKDD